MPALDQREYSFWMGQRRTTVIPTAAGAILIPPDLYGQTLTLGTGAPAAKRRRA